jgi:predicted dithiol-disulfide oxidoreductase (DUF899 family)/uncharacterized protein YndB with AHSA1/START domain
MTVISVDKDVDSLTFTLVAEFDAPIERVWRLWSDPRQLERWWGPPTHPATVEQHDLTPGGEVTYFMTGPEGDMHRGWWRVTTVDPPKSLEFVDGGANEDGTPNADMPAVTTQVTLAEHGGVTRMQLRSVFDSREQMDQWISTGTAEGVEKAVGQMDALLATWKPASPRDETTEDTMTGPQDTSDDLAGKPPVVDMATWQAARDELLVREKAHTREGDAIAAARRRMPMVELDGTVEVVGPDGPVPFLDLFQGRDELVVYKHMWYHGAPHQGQCEGCTTTAWHAQPAVAYLNARGVSFAVVTTGRWDEVAAYVEFMGYTQPWYSVRGLKPPVGGSMGSITCFLRDGDRVFLTYSTTGRGNEPANAALGLLDMTPYGRREAWQDDPEGWPESPEVGAPIGGHGAPICWYWRSDADGNATWGPTSRPVPQWTRPDATPVENLGRGAGDHGHLH